jgi:hypothetical protein
MKSIRSLVAAALIGAFAAVTFSGNSASAQVSPDGLTIDQFQDDVSAIFENELGQLFPKYITGGIGQSLCREAAGPAATRAVPCLQIGVASKRAVATIVAILNQYYPNGTPFMVTTQEVGPVVAD